MLIMVGVTVNVALTGGLFDTARKAASGMKMAQIKERVEFIKLALLADAESNNGIIIGKQELRNRIKEEFSDSEIQGNKVVIENGKYDIKINDTKLNTDITEHSEMTDFESILPIVVNNDPIFENEKRYGEKLVLSLNPILDEDEYVEFKIEEFNREQASVTNEKKEKKVYEYLTKATNEDITSIDQYMVMVLNDNDEGINYNTLEEWIEEEKLIEMFELEPGTKLSKGQIYNLMCGGEYPEEMAKDKLINALYDDIVGTPSIYKYINEYNKCTNRLNIYVVENEKEKLLYERYYINEHEDNNIDFTISKNGTYEIIVKTEDGEIVTSEVIFVNGIENNNPYALTTEDANGLWETSWIDGAWRITKYLGNETNVVVPRFIGNKEIKGLRCAFKNNQTIKSVYIPYGIEELEGGVGTFEGCSSLEKIVLPESLKDIGVNSFKGCINLEKIEIPDSVTYIYNYVFGGCTNLTTINFAPGDNPIPNGAPWGAPSNPTITKLTSPAE